MKYFFVNFQAPFFKKIINIQGRRKRSDHSDLGRTKNFVISGQRPIHSKVWSDQWLSGGGFLSNGRTNLALFLPSLIYIYTYHMELLYFQYFDSGDRQRIYASIISLLIEKPFYLLRPQSFSFQIVPEFIDTFVKFSNFMSRAFDSLFCPEGRVFVHNEGFLPPSSRVPGVCPGEWFWMKLIATLS